MGHIPPWPNARARRVPMLKPVVRMPQDGERWCGWRRDGEGSRAHEAQPRQGRRLLAGLSQTTV
eukprot:1916422-Rhodomonas_salina.2